MLRPPIYHDERVRKNNGTCKDRGRVSGGVKQQEQRTVLIQSSVKAANGKRNTRREREAL